MKRIASLLKHITVLMFGAAVLASCVKEDVPDGPDRPDSGGMTTLRMVVPGVVPVETRTPGTSIENRISDINVLVFDGDGLIEIVPGVNPVPQSGDGNTNQALWTFKAAIPKGRYDLMAIANAATLLSGIGEGDTKDDVAKALIVENTGMWDVSAAGSESAMTSIPMWGEITGQTIPGSSALEFRMVRMVARINVDATAVSSNFKMTSIKYYNRNTKGFVIPSGYATSEGKVDITAPTVPSGANLKGPLVYDDAYITDYKTCVEKIYVFEAAHKAAYGTDGWKDDPCLIIGGVYHEAGAAPSDPKTATQTFYRLNFIGKDKTTGGDKWLDILRNHSYNFTITSVSGDGYEYENAAFHYAPVNMEAEVTELDDMEYVVFDGAYYLGVSKDKVVLPFWQRTGFGTENIVTIKTNQGWGAAAHGDLAGTVDVPDDEVTGNPWLDVTSSLSGLSEIAIKLEKNTRPVARTAYVHITSGRLRCVVTVTQLPWIGGSDVTESFTSYVGAFWRAGQTGERVIHIPTTSTYTGNWAAQVLDYGGFTEGDIVFLAGDSNDPDIGTDTPGNAEAYKVNSAATCATGTATTSGGIRFRIGLTSTVKQSSVRYATVLVSFGNKAGSNDYPYHRVLYIRQGHAPDYLMRKTDPGKEKISNTETGASFNERPLAAKFSPYNITAPVFKTDVATESVNVGLRGGREVDYPTQAGAFFQWAQSGGVIAYNPTIPVLGLPAEFQTSVTVTSWWSTAKDTYESCPPGYRRPADGATDKAQSLPIAATDSEMFQSLFLNPPTNTSVSSPDNIIIGSYADGFFDRRTPGKQDSYNNMGGPVGSAVNANTSTVAYQGQLFFNPTTKASLFFPLAGFRSDSNGYLIYPGSGGYYWAGSSIATSYGYSLQIISGNNYYHRASNRERRYGFSVRCVVDKP